MRPYAPRVFLGFLLSLLSVATGQQVSPLQGQGWPPENGTDVYITIILDRLLSVDDVAYRFEAMLYFQLSWRDPRARAVWENSTQQAANDPSYNNGQGCSYPCTDLYRWEPGSPCCDGVWMPGLEFVNARGFSQDRPVRYRVALPSDEEDGGTAPQDTVLWWTYVLGDFYTPMQFNAFPFDNQYLLCQLQYADRNTSVPVRFIPSTTGLQLFRPKLGDDLSGWNVAALDIFSYDYSDYQNQLLGSTNTKYSAPGDPWPLYPSNKSVDAFQSILWHQGVNIVITVSRISSYYVIVAILPIAITVYLSILVFSISPKHLDTRLGIIMTLMLTLTAIQFVLASVLPSSSTVVPTQQLVIASYVTLGIIGVASIGVYCIVTAETQRVKRERSKQAARAFVRRWSTIVEGMGGLAATAVTATRRRLAAAAHLPATAAKDGGGAAATGSASGSGGSTKESDGGGDPVAVGSCAPSEDSHGGGLQAASANGSATGLDQRRKSVQFSDVSEDNMGVRSGAASDSDDEAGSYRSSDDEFPSHRRPAKATAADAEGPAAVLGEQADGQQSLRGLSATVGRRRTGAIVGGEADLEAGEGSMAGQQQGGAASSKEHPSGRKGWRGCCARWLWDKPQMWFRLQRLKFREMRQECRENPEYALFVANKVDKYLFWFCIVAYNLALILIFAIGAQQQPSSAAEADAKLI